MSTLRFNLRTDKPNRFAKSPLELIYQVSGQRKYFLVKDVKLNSLNWDSDTQSVMYINLQKAKKLVSAELQKQIDKVICTDSEVQDYNDIITKTRLAVGEIEKRFEIDQIPYTAAMVTEALRNRATPKTKKEEHKAFLFDFMDKYITDHTQSREAGSLSVYRSVKNHLMAFESGTGQKVRFENIDYAFFQQLQNFLINRTKTDKEGNHIPSLNNTTIAKALSTLKTFLGYAKKHGIKINDSYRDFSIKRESMEVIALTESEFEALVSMDLSENKRLDQVRDVFCFSCASGLRISDMEQLRWEHIKREEIKLIVKKTKTELTIPLNGLTAGILDKYKGKVKPLPLISSQKLNSYLKELCEKAGIDEAVEIVRFRGAKRETTIYPKYELIHLHTGRKTFCTLSLERGMSAEQVMSITGHTDYKSFKRYVAVTEKHKKVVMLKAWGAPVQHLKVV